MRNIVQTKNPRSGRYVKINRSKGMITAHKKSDRPYKNIPIIRREKKMKTATYTGTDGKKIKVKYDGKAPCRICGLPVEYASMGGTDVCPWCDCGNYRDGTIINVRELMVNEKLRKRAKEIYEKMKEVQKMKPEEAIEIVNRVFHYDESEIFTKEQKEGIVNCLMRGLRLEQILEKVEDNLKNVYEGCSVDAEDMLCMIENLKKED